LNSPLIPLPPAAPRTQSRFGRWFGLTILRLGGWRMDGEFPDLPRAVLIAAPHSSGWDAFWGLAAKLALGLRIEFMAKQELFWWPLGALLRAIGGFPVNRRSAEGVVEQLTARMQRQPQLWLLLAPEGTRRRVQQWKTGFWRIATSAEVPVICAYFHYPTRTIGIGECMRMSGDLDADIARIRAFYRPWRGKHRGIE
jgi:1-acyl-sn-glycerol-3-phosphate acyltransferase